MKKNLLFLAVWMCWGSAVQSASWVDEVFFSKPVGITLTGGWIGTCGILKAEGMTLTGFRNEPCVLHHGHVGCLGYYGVWVIKKYYPNFYNNLSPWVKILPVWAIGDDTYQHAWAQRHDKFRDPDDDPDLIASSPLNQFYHWAMDPGQNDNLLRVQIVQPVYKQLNLIGGFYQGLFAGLEIEQSLFWNISYVVGSMVVFEWSQNGFFEHRVESFYVNQNLRCNLAHHFGFDAGLALNTVTKDVVPVWGITLK